MVVGIVLAAVVILLLLITVVKWHPFVALILTAIGVGLAMGMPLIGTSPKDPGIIDSIKLGLGNTLGFLAIVLALGTMLGKMMAESGGAERIANTLINRFGKKRVHWAMMFVAFLVGYVAMPLDLIPDFLPFIGILDDIGIVLFILNRIVKMAPVQLQEKHNVNVG
ncbi:GntT/GntP/DsdX family permease [Bacillus sp. HC-TM]